MKKKSLLFCLLVIFLLSASRMQAIDHGSVYRTGVQLNYEGGDNIGQPAEGYTVDYKIVTIGLKTYAWTKANAGTLNEAGWGSQLKLWPGGEAWLDNRSADKTEAWATVPNPQNANQEIAIFQAVGDGGNKLTGRFVYDGVTKYTPATGDAAAPTNVAATATPTDNAITFELSAQDANAFFYYIYDDWGVETASFFPTVTISGLMAGTDYNFHVVAIDFSGNESAVKDVPVTTTGTRPEFNALDNLALNKIASTSYGTASAGNDGNIGTRWRSNNANQEEWWMVNLGAEYVVNNVKIIMNGDAGARNATYEIQTSLTGAADSWTTVVSDGQIPAGSADEFNDHAFNPVPARFVRYNGLTKGGWDHNFAEFEVYGTGYYDPAAGDDLNSVSVTPTGQTTYVNDEFQFTAYALSGKSEPIADATIVWSVDPTTATLSQTGLFVAQATGLYTITATATAGDITKSGTATVTVDAARTPATLTFTLPNSIYVAKEKATFTSVVTDQYGKVMNDATITYTTTLGVIDAAAKTITFTEKEGGLATLTATVAGSDLQGTIDLTVVTNNKLKKANMTATATTELTNAETGAVTQPASWAIDGNGNTRWVSITGDPATVGEQSITVDLGGLHKLSMVEIEWEGAYAKDYNIEVSATEDGTYTPIAEYRNLAPYTRVHRTLADPEAEVQFIRVRGITAATGYGYSIWEITAYEDGLPNIVAVNEGIAQGISFKLDSRTDNKLRIQGDVVNENNKIGDAFVKISIDGTYIGEEFKPTIGADGVSRYYITVLGSQIPGYEEGQYLELNLGYIILPIGDWSGYVVENSYITSGAQTGLPIIHEVGTGVDLDVIVEEPPFECEKTNLLDDKTLSAGGVFFATGGDWVTSANYTYTVENNELNIHLGDGTWFQWQAQFRAILDRPAYLIAGEKYSLQFNVTSTANVPVYVKFFDDNDNAFLDIPLQTVAAPGKILERVDITCPGDLPQITQILFDFGGNAANTDLTISDFVLCGESGEVSINTANANAINIYPTLVQNILHITGIRSEVVKITDLAGKTVVNQSSNGTIDVSHLNAGIYILQVKGATAKFIKQ
jgi:hypothetical protein